MIPQTILLLLFLSCCRGMGNSAFGHPFELLPRQSAWQSMMTADGINAQNITDLVATYMAPFEEYQAAARNLSLPAGKIKENTIAALDLMLEASKSFLIPQEEYDQATQDLDALLHLPSTIFTLKRASSVSPTFNPATLDAFTRLRMRHLITHKSGYMNFLVAKYQYEMTLKEWKITATRLPACRFRTLMPRNIDLAYVQRMEALYLDVMRLRVQDYPDGKIPKHLELLSKVHKDRLLKNMEAMGNGYAVSKPPYSMFIVVTSILYALLVSIMI